MDIIKELDPLFRDCIMQQIRLMANLHRKSKEQEQESTGKDKKLP
jgi:hypothetical protein